jgi:hypothetical protein
VSLRASFDGVDPTLRTILAVIGVDAVPHPQYRMIGGHTLYHNDGTPWGTCLGVYTSNDLWKVITERKPEQSILAALKAAAQVAEAA